MGGQGKEKGWGNSWAPRRWASWRVVQPWVPGRITRGDAVIPQGPNTGGCFAPADPQGIPSVSEAATIDRMTCV